MRTFILSSLLVCSVAFGAEESAQLPSWFPPPSGYSVSRVTYADYDALNMQLPPRDRMIAGTVWRARLEPADKKIDCQKQLRPTIAEALQRDGFRFVHENWILQKGEGDHVTYVKFSGCDLYILEPGPNPFRVTPKPPAARPEQIGANDDLPYLPPVDGSKLVSAKKESGQFHFVSPCDKNVEARATAHTVRVYAAPKGSSDLALRGAYDAALRAGGWDYVCSASGVTAHYTRNHRDLWAHAYFALQPPTPTYTLELFDTGDALRDALAKGCSAALYGVNFDFDKATLRPDSDPVLNQLLTLLEDEGKLAVEISGHTDNVGKPDYNAKLSDERAAAVKQWLVAHGIAASRLSSRGYGDTRPLVPNTSDDNRARNRRVEVTRSGCK